MADKIPVILSQARAAQGDHAELEKQLIEGLSRWPEIELHVVSHLYDLPADGPGMQRLQSIAGDMIVLAWLYPRSTFWVLDANRIRGRPGRTGSLPDEGPDQLATRVNAPEVPDRTIWCFDLRAHDRLKPCLDEIRRIVDTVVERVGESVEGGIPSSAEAGVDMLAQARAGHPAPTGAPNRVDEASRPRWYPVIDYERCTNCLECLSFCLFGVYGLDDAGGIVAEEPDACRPGCPACARICPAGAIMFPEHHDPAIAGDPKASLEGLKLDLSQLFGGADPVQLAAAERDRALAEKHGQEAESEKAQAAQPPAKDDLDRLVDEVDELDL